MPLAAGSSNGERVASPSVTDSSPEPTTPGPTTPGPTTPEVVRDVPDASRTEVAQEVDFDVIERDLAAVETALQRLSDGTYWTDEVTGEPIPEYVLAADPTTRRA